jgi:ABC-type phosphate transport system substrate-binding protein
MRSSWLLLVGALCAAAACTTLKSRTDRPDVAAGDTATDTPIVSGDSAGDCIDPTGFNGAGCYSCTPQTRQQLLNACSTATCVPFNNAMRLPQAFDGGLPMLPQGTDAGTDSAPPGDSGPPVDSGVPSCATLPTGNVLYAMGSSAAALFLGQVAQALENATPPITVVYQSSGSCIGVNAAVSPATTRLTGTAVYYDPNQSVDPTSPAAQLHCALDPGGVAADVGISDVFPGTCLDLPGGLDMSLRDFQGPIQTMTMVVPQNSMQRAISAEAAYLVWGFGGMNYPVDPWTDPTLLFQRSASSGTQSMIAAAIGVSRFQWFGRTNAGSGNVRDALLAAGMAGSDPANRALGILGTDIADTLRDRIRILAYQHYAQNCAFYPDSSVTARDKRNVRDGHYPIFGPLHMIARVDPSTHMASSPAVQRLINVINGVETLSGVNVIDIYARQGLTPQCAMRVTRNADGGDIVPFAPDHSCGCYFEERASGLSPPPGCTPCDRADQCPSTAPNCNHFTGQTGGYCEP